MRLPPEKKNPKAVTETQYGIFGDGVLWGSGMYQALSNMKKGTGLYSGVVLVKPTRCRKT